MWSRRSTKLNWSYTLLQDAGHVSGVFYLPNFKVLLQLKNSLKTFSMQELIDKLKADAGLTDEQAKKAIEAVKNYVVEKFPMLEGAVGNLFGN
jgi:hypothetical protein